MFRILADLAVLLHLGFVLFSVFGGLLCLRRKAFAFVHIPAAVWATTVEVAGWICPLTPLENTLRRMAGDPGYSADFIERYLMPVLYPGELTRSVQVMLGMLVLGVNVVVYLGVYRHWRKKA